MFVTVVAEDKKDDEGVMVPAKKGIFSRWGSSKTPMTPTPAPPTTTKTPPNTPEPVPAATSISENAQQGMYCIYKIGTNKIGKSIVVRFLWTVTSYFVKKMYGLQTKAGTRIADKFKNSGS